MVLEAPAEFKEFDDHPNPRCDYDAKLPKAPNSCSKVQRVRHLTSCSWWDVSSHESRQAKVTGSHKLYLRNQSSFLENHRYLSTLILRLFFAVLQDRHLLYGFTLQYFR